MALLLVAQLFTLVLTARAPGCNRVPDPVTRYEFVNLQPLTVSPLDNDVFGSIPIPDISYAKWATPIGLNILKPLRSLNTSLVMQSWVNFTVELWLTVSGAPQPFVAIQHPQAADYMSINDQGNYAFQPFLWTESLSCRMIHDFVVHFTMIVFFDGFAWSVQYKQYGAQEELTLFDSGGHLLSPVVQPMALQFANSTEFVWALPRIINFTIYQLAIYNYSLTDSQVQQNWEAWLPNTPPSLINTSTPCLLDVPSQDTYTMTFDQCYLDFDLQNGPQAGPCAEDIRITIYTLPHGNVYPNATFTNITLKASDLPYTYSRSSPPIYISPFCELENTCNLTIQPNYTTVTFSVADRFGTTVNGTASFTLKHVIRPPRPSVLTVVPTDLQDGVIVQLTGVADTVAGATLTGCYLTSTGTVRTLTTLGTLYANISNQWVNVLALNTTIINSTSANYTSSGFWVDVAFNSTYNISRPSFALPFEPECNCCKLKYVPQLSLITTTGLLVIATDFFAFGLTDSLGNYTLANQNGTVRFDVLNPLQAFSGNETLYESSPDLDFQFNGSSKAGVYVVKILSGSVNGELAVGSLTSPTILNGTNATALIPDDPASKDSSGNRNRARYRPTTYLHGDLEHFQFLIQTPDGKYTSNIANKTMRVLPINNPPTLNSTFPEDRIFEHLLIYDIPVILKDPDRNLLAPFYVKVGCLYGNAHVSLNLKSLSGYPLQPTYYVNFTQGDGNFDLVQEFEGWYSAGVVMLQDIVAFLLNPISVRCFGKGAETLQVYVSDMDQTTPGPYNFTYNLNFTCDQAPAAVPASISNVPVLIVMWIILAFIPFFCFYCWCYKQYQKYRPLPRDAPEGEKTKEEPVGLDELASPGSVGEPSSPTSPSHVIPPPLPPLYHPVPATSSPRSQSVAIGQPSTPPAHGISPSASPEQGESSAAATGVNSAAKPPWRRYKDDQTGQEYYFNKLTKESLWERPGEYEEGHTTDEEAG